jgi:hypothetical protein
MLDRTALKALLTGLGELREKRDADGKPESLRALIHALHSWRATKNVM